MAATQTKEATELKRSLPLIQSSSYYLNNSKSKRVDVGLEYNESSEKYRPVIQLACAHYSQALDFDIASWEELEDYIDEINKYFNLSGQPYMQRTKLKDIDIILTTSFGVKSVIFAKREIYNCGGGGGGDSPEQPARKKRGSLTSITMQRNTFGGLVNVLVCVNEQYRRLERYVPEINQCKNFIYEQIKDFVTLYDFQGDNSRLNFKNEIFEKRKYFKDNVYKKFDATSQTFVQCFFDVAFIEMLILHANVFHDEILNFFNNQDAQTI